MRTVSTGISTAQKAASCTPYIKLVFTNGKGGVSSYTYTTTDSTRRILSVKHVEEPYNDTCIVLIQNASGAFPDLVGYYCDVSYGYVIAGVPDITGGTTSPLWVKSQSQTSKPGSKDIILYLEGAWNLLAELTNIGSLLGGSAPYYEVDYSATAYTVYDIIEAVIEATGFELAALGAHDDGIINTLEPMFVVNSLPFEDARAQIYRLLNMTKCMMRIEANTGAVSKEDNTMIGGLPASASNPAHRLLFAKTRWWQFYVERVPTEDLYFTSSTDRVVWAAKTKISDNPTNASHDDCDVVLDAAGENVHIAFGYTLYDGSYNIRYQIKYRKGALATDGTIVWQDERIIYDSGGYTDWIKRQSVAIVLDCDGLPTVMWTTKHLDSFGQDWVVERSTTSDGTWTAAGNTVLQSDVGLTLGAVFSMCLVAGDYGDLTALWGRPNTGSWPTTSGLYAAHRASDYTWEAAAKVVDVSEYNAWSAVEYSYYDQAMIAYQAADYYLHNIVFDLEGSGIVSDTEVDTSLSAVAFPSISMYEGIRKAVMIWPSALHWYYREYNLDSDTWGEKTDWATITSLFGAGCWSTPRVMPVAMISLCYSAWASPYHIMHFLSIPTVAGIADVLFHIIYPAYWSSYHATYTSNQTGSDYQFKDFQWENHLFVPTHIWVIANRVDTVEGLWDAGEVKLGEYSVATDNNYPDTVQFHIAETLDTEAKADDRAEVIAIRQWMEESLGKLVVQHDCGLELYDFIKIRDKRGIASYTNYPTAGRWDNTATHDARCVVGSLTHTFGPGVYELQIGLNGISSDIRSMLETVRKPKTVEELEKEINWGFIGGVGGGGLLPEQQSTAQPFKPILDPARYGGKPAAWNAMLDLATGGNQIRRDITNQAIVWAGKVAPQYQKPAGFDEWLANLGKNSNMVQPGTAQPPTKVTPTTQAAPTTNPALRLPGESTVDWMNRVNNPNRSR